MKVHFRLLIVLLYSAVLSLLPSVAMANENAAVRAEDDARNHLVTESIPAIYNIEITGTMFDTKTGTKKVENVSLGTGTAFGVTADGLVLTKMHILNPFFGKITSRIVGANTFQYADGDGVSISIILHKKDGTKYHAMLDGGDPDDPVDLAMLKIVTDTTTNANNKYSYLIFADALLGYDRVVSIGSPLGFPFSVGEGVVSNPDVVIKSEKYPERHYVQTTALISPGSSGGPLIRVRDHRVVGMIDHLFSPLPNVNVGIGFATPSSVLQEFLEKELRRRNSDTGTNQ